MAVVRDRTQGIRGLSLPGPACRLHRDRHQFRGNSPASRLSAPWTPPPHRVGTVSPNQLTALLCHWSRSHKALPTLSIVYKRTLIPEGDGMLLREASPPSPPSAGLPIKVIILCSNNSSCNLLACHGVSRRSLGSVANFGKASQEPCYCGEPAPVGGFSAQARSCQGHFSRGSSLHNFR